MILDLLRMTKKIRLCWAQPGSDRPTDKSDASPELALAVKPEHRRHGIGTALLTQLVRANPDHSTISVSFVAGKPVLRLYERFGFKVVEQRPDAVVMHRPT